MYNDFTDWSMVFFHAINSAISFDNDALIKSIARITFFYGFIEYQQSKQHGQTKKPTTVDWSSGWWKSGCASQKMLMLLTNNEITLHIASFTRELRITDKNNALLLLLLSSTSSSLSFSHFLIPFVLFSCTSKQSKPMDILLNHFRDRKVFNWIT